MSRGTSLSYQLTSTIGKRDVAQLLSHIWLLATAWTAACQASLSFTISWSCSNSCSLSWWCLLTISFSVTPFSSCPQSFPASGIRKITSIRVLFNEKDAALHIRLSKYWSFSFNISPSNEYSGLISFRIDYFDFFAVQGTLKRFLQHLNSKAAILWHSAKESWSNSHVRTRLLEKP